MSMICLDWRLPALLVRAWCTLLQGGNSLLQVYFNLNFDGCSVGNPECLGIDRLSGPQESCGCEPKGLIFC